jgi:outer membrane protein assembly factor BamD
MNVSRSAFVLRGGLPVLLVSAALLGAGSNGLRAQSEGLVKSKPIENQFFPQGSATDQLANADSFADSGDTEKAITVYRFVARTYPKSTEAPKAQFRLAKQLRQKGDFEAAFKEYQNLLQRYPQTPDFESAVSEQIEIANAFLKGKRVRFLGIPMVPSMERAEEMYLSILKTAPYSKHAPITQFNLALAMEKQGKAQDAITAYQKVIDKYPNSPVCDDAQYQIGYVYQRLGMDGKSQDLSALKESQNNYQDFLLQYPNSEKAKQADENMKKMTSREAGDTLRIARFYDFNKDFKAASIYYNDVIRRFPQTADSSAAKTRLDELKALYGEDALRVGQERPENGERLAQKKRLEAQVESTALANYNGPPRKEIVGEDLPAPQPKMKGDMRDAQPIPLQEPPAQKPAQKTVPPTQ